MVLFPRRFATNAITNAHGGHGHGHGYSHSYYRNNNNNNSITRNPYSNAKSYWSRCSFRSLTRARKLAVVIFIFSALSIISVIFSINQSSIGYGYFYNQRYYYPTQYSFYDSTISSFSSSNFVKTSSSQKIRQKALQAAKKQTNRWIQSANADENELQNIIDSFKKELKKLKNKEEQAKMKLEQEKEMQEKDLINDEYYLYYQDDNDLTSTVIGLPLLSDTSSSNPNKRSKNDEDVNVYIRRFVTSLRKTGFGGQIIIGLEVNEIFLNQDENDDDNGSDNNRYATVTKDTLEFLKHPDNNVIIKNLIPVECSFEFAKKNQKCYYPYSHIKREWSYFPIARDWLASCDTCIGSVAVTSMKHTIFQRNPFGKGMPIVQRLQLFQLHPSEDSSGSSAGVLLKACENIDLDKVDFHTNEQMDDDAYFKETKTKIKRKRYKLISAGTAVGTRDDVMDYLGVVYSVMREWMHRSQCHFEHSSSDNGIAIVNYLKLQDRLPYRTKIIPFRFGIVSNVGYDGTMAYESHLHFWNFKGLSDEQADQMPYEGSTVSSEGDEGSWIGSEYFFTDEEGNFIDVFSQTSAIIYEYNSFGPPFVDWFDKKINFTIPSPDPNFKKNETLSLSASLDEMVISKPAPITEKDVQSFDDQLNDHNGHYIENEDISLSTVTSRKVNKNNTSDVQSNDIKSAANATNDEDQEQPMYYKDPPTSGDIDETIDDKILESINNNDHPYHQSQKNNSTNIDGVEKGKSTAEKKTMSQEKKKGKLKKKRNDLSQQNVVPVEETLDEGNNEITSSLALDDPESRIDDAVKIN